MQPTSSEDNVAAVQSTNIFIYSNGCLVGMVQSFSVSDNRPVDKLQSIGWEGVVQAVPQNYKGGTITAERIALYESTVWNALGLTTSGVPFNEIGSKVYDSTAPTDANNWDVPTVKSEEDGYKASTRLIFKTLKDQRVPLEIQVKTRREGSSEDYYTETYIDCWIQNYNKTYTVQRITVAENVTIAYADIY